MSSLRPLLSVLGLALLASAWMMPPTAEARGAAESEVVAWHNDAQRAIMPEPPPVVQAPVSPGHVPAGTGTGEPAPASPAVAPHRHGGKAVDGDLRALSASYPPLYDLYRVYRL